MVLLDSMRHHMEQHSAMLQHIMSFVQAQQPAQSLPDDSLLPLTNLMELTDLETKLKEDQSLRKSLVILYLCTIYYIQQYNLCRKLLFIILYHTLTFVSILMYHNFNTLN